MPFLKQGGTGEQFRAAVGLAQERGCLSCTYVRLPEQRQKLDEELSKCSDEAVLIARLLGTNFYAIDRDGTFAGRQEKEGRSPLSRLVPTIAPVVAVPATYIGRRTT